MKEELRIQDLESGEIPIGKGSWGLSNFIERPNLGGVPWGKGKGGLLQTGRKNSSGNLSQVEKERCTSTGNVFMEGQKFWALKNLIGG